MSDKCKCGAHISTVWNFATCPVCEKLELREEITRLKALLERARYQVTRSDDPLDLRQELLADIDEVLGDE